MLSLLLMLNTVAGGNQAATAPFSATTVESERLAPSGSEAFGQLKGLVGRWRGQRPDGRSLEITYRLSAGGTVLVETWALGPGRESLTLYHMDSDRLIATHYCPQGNQPRLIMSRASSRRFDFALRDITDLQSDEGFQQAFWIAITGDSVIRSETYMDAGVPSTETITYKRVGGG